MGGADPRDSTVRQYLEWMVLNGCSPETIATRRRWLRQLERALPVPILEATREHLLAYRASLAHLGDNTIREYVSRCRALYAWAVDEEIIERDPCRRIPVPRHRQGLPRPVAEAEAFRAVLAAPRDIRLMLVLMGWEGLRCCEVAGLDRACVLDTARKPVIRVAETATKGRRARSVGLGRFALEELAIYGLPVRGPVFRRLDGHAGFNAAHVISHRCGGYLRGEGVDASAHRFRHFFGSAYYRESGHDVVTLARLMGHASVLTTQGYAWTDDSAAAAVLDALPVPRRLRQVSGLAGC